jgi:DNA-binding GntR family transcriptional regulator
MGETRVDQIAESLRRSILRGDLPPGAPLKERDFAAEMGVSRTPMREAIRQLASEGLVELRPSRSPVVADPSWKEISDSIDVLRALELLAVEQVCLQASGEEIDEIEVIQRRMEAMVGQVDDIDLFEADMAFHTAIANASHNAPLAEMYQALLARLWRARFLGSREGRSLDVVYTQHNAVISAMRARDTQQAQAEMRGHLALLKERMKLVFFS